MPGGTKLPGSSLPRFSCQSHMSTEPGSCRFFSTLEALVRSRHRPSTTTPFFSFETCAGQSNFQRRDKQNYLGVYAQVLSTGQAQTHEPTLLCFLLVCLGSLYSVFHQSLEFRQRLFDFRDCSRAVDEFALCRIELWTRCVKSRVCVTSNRITC